MREVEGMWPTPVSRARQSKKLAVGVGGQAFLHSIQYTARVYCNLLPPFCPSNASWRPRSGHILPEIFRCNTARRRQSRESSMVFSLRSSVIKEVQRKVYLVYSTSLPSTHGSPGALQTSIERCMDRDLRKDSACLSRAPGIGGGVRAAPRHKEVEEPARSQAELDQGAAVTADLGLTVGCSSLKRAHNLNSFDASKIFIFAQEESSLPQHGNEKGMSPPGVQERLIKLQRAMAVLAECQPFGLLQMSGFLAPDECAAIIAMAVGAVVISAATPHTSKPYCDRSKAAPCIAKGAIHDVESCGTVCVLSVTRPTASPRDRTGTSLLLPVQSFRGCDMVPQLIQVLQRSMLNGGQSV